MNPHWAQRLRSTGTEPDPRFSFANERTFLAWIRTAVALIAAGVALEAFADGLGRPGLRRGVAAALVVLGALVSGVAFRRWLRAERALRTSNPLPLPVFAPAIGYGIAVISVLILIVVLAGRG
ncbi:MAG: putative rane protein [Mycobacteriales bacterium]|jgi:putative membrane protein